MRASTVFILALSLLVGLGGVSVAKYMGLFSKKEAPPPGPPPLPEKVLVAGVTLYKDMTATADMVMVRDLRPGEKEELETRFGPKWRERLMPPLTSAAHMRVARQTIEADQPLFRSQFEEPNLPDRLTTRLAPNTRAVNVSVPKNRAAGGAVRVDDYVDVLLTTTVASGDREETRTAPIARRCKVIMKRNNPWSMLGSDPDDKPMDFTLQANVYRAALIDYAKGYGELTLLPVPTPPETNGTFSDPTSKEYANEDQRVDEVNRGERTIGEEDLARIFKPNPPAPRVPAVPPVVVQHLVGVSDAGRSTFPSPQPGGNGNGAAGGGTNGNVGGAPVGPPAPAQPANPVQPAGGVGSAAPRGGNMSAGGAVASAGYAFRLPNATDDPGCKTCGGAKPAPKPVVRGN
jgi:Flp pilus assembly protein CpaB